MDIANTAVVDKMRKFLFVSIHYTSTKNV